MNSSAGLCSPKISLNILPWLACPSCALVRPSPMAMAWLMVISGLDWLRHVLGYDSERLGPCMTLQGPGWSWLVMLEMADLACHVPDSGSPITDPNAGLTLASGHLVSGQNGLGSRGNTDVDILVPTPDTSGDLLPPAHSSTRPLPTSVLPDSCWASQPVLGLTRP